MAKRHTRPSRHYDPRAMPAGMARLHRSDGLCPGEPISSQQNVMKSNPVPGQRRPAEEKPVTCR